ncbi:MAG: hypothetical protein ACI843_001468 [Psychrobacter glaciei]|jgi:hypothetical protein
MFLDDGSIYLNGKIAFVSLQRFRDKVCSGKVCFLCADENSEPTKEHVIPEWILRKYSLYNQSITLTNGTKHKYKDYVVSCCWKCNQLLSTNFETPISKMFEKGFEELKGYLIDGEDIRVFCWLALIFIKMHYKDNFLRMERDKRAICGSIAKDLEYDWGEMHHVYCLARSFYCDAKIEHRALGSLAIFHIKADSEGSEQFDVGDITFSNTFGIRVGDIGLIVCFGDGGAVLNKLNQLFLQKLEGPLNFPQFRELIAQFACWNLHLQNPPILSTLTDKISGTVSIVCTKLDPEPIFCEFKSEVLGSLMTTLLYSSTKNNINILDYEKRLKLCEVSFLFGSDSKFIKND